MLCWLCSRPLGNDFGVWLTRCSACLSLSLFDWLTVRNVAVTLS